MRDVILVMFEDHDAATEARTDFVSSGFPTDRVKLTSASEPGQADASPSPSLEQKLRDYFATLFDTHPSDGRPAELARAVVEGQAVLAIHPRGAVEIEQTDDILDRHQSLETIRLIQSPDEHSGVLGEHAAGRARDTDAASR